MKLVPAALWKEVLDEWRGAKADVWMFHVSHRRFVLRLSRPGEREALFVVAAACTHVVGPFSWEGAAVSIARHGPASAAAVPEVTELSAVREDCVSDPGAGFELRCLGVALAIGMSTLDPSFEWVRVDSE